MSTYSILDISITADRFKLYTLMCNVGDLQDKIAFVNSQNVNVINIGKEIAAYLDELEDYSYLAIDVQDYLSKLFDKYKAKIDGSGNHVLAIYNLGILKEPVLKINAEKILKEFSKSSALILIWEHESKLPNIFNWSTQENLVFLDFSDTPLKKMQNAI